MTVRPLPYDLRIIAQNELNEKPAEVDENIRIIKQWILKQPHLCARTDDQKILTYLRGCKFSIEKTKQKIDHYYRLRTIAPEMYANRDPSSPEIKEFLDKGIFLPLETNVKGPQSFLIRLGIEGTHHIPLISMAKFGIMICDIVLNEDDYIVLGQNVIYDLKGMKLSRLVEVTINDIKNLLSLRHGLPVRIKSVIILNAPPAAYHLIEIIKVLLGEKLGNMVRACPEGHLEELYKHVPISIIPKEYGGDACLNKRIDYWKQKMTEYEDWFLEDAAYGTDESKRIYSKSNEDYFGVDGSFRKLAID